MRQLGPIQSAVADYYARSLAINGASARGVDWSSREGQELRFETLLSGLDLRAGRTLLDYGCGYGALVAYLDGLGARCRYIGYDIAPSMIAEAQSVLEWRGERYFTSDPSQLEPVEYVVASGIFNVKLDTPPAVWEQHVHDTLRAMAALTTRRMSFNMLPPPSSPELARRDLHYAEPAAVTRFCETELDCEVSLHEGYGLWEFTVHASRRVRL